MSAPAETARKELDTEEAEPGSLIITVWFPDQDDAEPAILTIGKTVRLRVSLGPKAETPIGEGEPPPLPQGSVDHVTASVYSGGCHVTPISRRMDLPPDPRKPVEFNLLPEFPGKTKIRVCLLVQNDPIGEVAFEAEIRTSHPIP